MLCTCVLCVTHYIFKFAVGLATKTVKFYGIQIIMEAPNLILGIDHQAESLKINFQLQISYFYKEYFFVKTFKEFAQLSGYRISGPTLIKTLFSHYN